MRQAQSVARHLLRVTVAESHVCYSSSAGSPPVLRSIAVARLAAGPTGSLPGAGPTCAFFPLSADTGKIVGTNEQMPQLWKYMTGLWPRPAGSADSPRPKTGVVLRSSGPLME
jgi:hypothetical protein